MVDDEEGFEIAAFGEDEIEVEQDQKHDKVELEQLKKEFKEGLRKEQLEIKEQQIVWTVFIIIYQIESEE